MDNFRQIIKQKTPLLDLRAPIEFNKGAFTQSVNLPLMLDDERAKVGLCYKQHGQDAAITLGNQLVGGAVRESRLASWQNFARENPQGYLYCFRGGLRSSTVMQWLADVGIDYPLVQGGYKAMRQFLLSQLEQLAAHPLVLIGGNTGCGKTLLLEHCDHSLDLEGAAGHRGSSFGAFVTPQASQINFENRLAEQYVCGDFESGQRLVLEDEGRLIGSVHLPDTLRNAMAQAPVVVIELDFEPRLESLYQEYVVKMCADFIAAYGDVEGFAQFSRYLALGLEKLRKRLGPQRYQQLSQLMEKALKNANSGDSLLHLDWLSPLVKEYYDPMYQYQLGQKEQRIVFRGNKEQCLAYFSENQA